MTGGVVRERRWRLQAMEPLPLDRRSRPSRRVPVAPGCRRASPDAAGVGRRIDAADRRGPVDPASVDWFLCHYSARSLRQEMVKLATHAGCMIAEERWFTNLYEKGNVGAASLFLLLDDLLRGNGWSRARNYCARCRRADNASWAMRGNDGGGGRTQNERSPDRGRPIAGWPRCGSTSKARWSSVPVIDRLCRGGFGSRIISGLLINLRQQVVEGSRWISRAASSLRRRMRNCGRMFVRHAAGRASRLPAARTGLCRDRRRARADAKRGQEHRLGGACRRSCTMPPASPILSDCSARCSSSKGLAADWRAAGPKLVEAQSKLPDEAVSFFKYHGENDADHLEDVRPRDRTGGDRARPCATTIVKPRQDRRAALRLQLEELDNV